LSAGGDGNRREELVLRIAFVGAGSVVFTRNLLTDILSFSELHGATVVLHDIDPERLQTAGMMARWTSEQLGAGARVEEHHDLGGALDGADFVVNMVQIGTHEATLLDFEIPKKYGLKQTIADSMGIGGIFRGLRTIPFVLNLAEEMKARCPDALLMNYTNPMSILMEALYTAHPDVKSIGLCHSVPLTAREIASYIGVDHGQLLFECAGINHIAWMTRLEVEGEDAYPLLFTALENPEVYAKDRIRFELMRRFGYFVTESSEHNAEYTPYFLREDDLIEIYDVPVDEYVRRSEENLVEYAETRRKLLDGENFPLQRSVEYGSLIIHSLVTDEARPIYGNVENTGLITNLPQSCCVEVPILVDGAGLHPCHVGDLPPQCAAACAPHTAVQNLTVRAALEGNRNHVHHAAMLDRHAPSVLSLDEIAAMVDDLIEAHGDAMPEGIRTSEAGTRRSHYTPQS
jgi:alpha-galactosidase